MRSRLADSKRLIRLIFFKAGEAEGAGGAGEAEGAGGAGGAGGAEGAGGDGEVVS
ncbi:hypothetical protein [Coleofasciculus sp. E1-EBD-02]|uniref:hypothetical protein n=1 Tax=Coleofasciculus sp. E1-EBD-02 TaxID=3068481 RepID=UPI0032F40C04